MKRLPVLLMLLTGAVSSTNAQVIDEFSGQETFMRFCAACHGESAEGNGPVAEGLPIKVPDLTTLKQRWGKRYQDDLLRKIIEGNEPVVVHGTRFMPVWGYDFWITEAAGNFSEENVDAILTGLVDYLESIQVESD